jgi:hypothetical protein
MVLASTSERADADGGDYSIMNQWKCITVNVIVLFVFFVMIVFPRTVRQSEGFTPVLTSIPSIPSNSNASPNATDSVIQPKESNKIPVDFNVTYDFNYPVAKSFNYTESEASLKSLCRLGEHIPGNWEYYERPEKAYTCCRQIGRRENNPNEPGSCPRKTKVYGDDEWVGDVISGGQAGGEGCHCDIHENTRLNISKREKWIWQPIYCDLMEFNATEFCNVLGKRKLLLLGDSTMDQSGVSLVLQLSKSRQPCANQIIYGHCNHLKWYSNADFKNITPSKYDESVTYFMNKYDPDIVVFGAGAHYHALDEYELMLKTFASDFEDYISQVKPSKSKSLSVYWKTINPGVLGCIKNAGSGPKPYNKQVYTKDNDKYQWRFHPTFDMYAKRLANELNIRVLDMSPLYNRPDPFHAHLGPNKDDCLHQCLPGPIDIFSQLVYQDLYIQQRELIFNQIKH